MARRPVLNALTGIRFIAALYVVLFHYLDPARLDLALPAHFAVYHLVRYGYVGVSVFFVLSGFVLAYNYPTFEDPAGRRCFLAGAFCANLPAIPGCSPAFSAGICFVRGSWFVA